MCGIAGWIGNVSGNPRELGLGMAAALRHRGPDASGILDLSNATLIHTRLSILDLASTGAQPMANEDGTIWTVFNGEIYNHHEIRQRLICRGHQFRGRSDTEILPHLYEERGTDLFSELRGMFALAIYDIKRQRLLLARDRFGIKPLFYSAGSGQLGFASEINALRLLPWANGGADPQAIHDFAALGYIPAPATFYKGIRSIEPGQFLDSELGRDTLRWSINRYHHWRLEPDQSLTLESAINRADELLDCAVRRQLESDVPVGALLSGGIDSSLVSQAAQRESGGMHTFNVRFAEGAYDETWAAVAAAKHIGSDHKTLEFAGLSGSWDYITGLLRHAGQPFADTSLFAVNRISHLMRQHVTVALSGDGGDEGFGGYTSYSRIGTIIKWQNLPGWVRRASIWSAPIFTRASRALQNLPLRMEELSDVDDVNILETLQCWIRSKEREALLIQNSGVQPVRRLFEPQWDHGLPPKTSRLERLSVHNTEINVRLRMANDYLFKVDTASMRESLEVRVPLLDEDLFAFGMTLPHRLRVSGGQGKRVLRAVANRRLPASVVAKPKAGFRVPIDTWVTVDFKRSLRAYLLDESSRLPEFFRPKAYRPVIEAFCGGGALRGISREGLYQRVIMLLAVQLALEERVQA